MLKLRLYSVLLHLSLDLASNSALSLGIILTTLCNLSCNNVSCILLVVLINKLQFVFDLSKKLLKTPLLKD